MALILAWSVACAPEAMEPLVAEAVSPLLSIDRNIDRTRWEGLVQERVEAGGYTYLRVEQRWVVGLDKPVAVGDRVSVSPIGRAFDFTSHRTERRFDEVDFAVIRPL